MYNKKSLKAEEFICHEEVIDSLAYADENKNNKKLIRSILEMLKKEKDFLIEKLQFYLHVRMKLLLGKCITLQNR